MSEKPPIINLNELELNDFGHGEKFSARLGRIGAPLGMQKMGCGLVVLEPGKRAWPYHGHHVAVEAFIVLEGEGTVVLDGKEHPLRKGSLVHIPPGVVHASMGKMRVLVVGMPDISDDDLFFPEDEA